MRDIASTAGGVPSWSKGVGLPPALHMHRYSASTLLNFLPIRTGGGLQNALSFVETLGDLPETRHQCISVVRKGSALEEMCVAKSMEHTAVAPTLWGRWVFERNAVRRFGSGLTCFTFFGPPMVGTCGNWVNMVGCAYSNLFYPEVRFWHYLPPISRLKAELVDLVRRRGVTCADYWVFETSVLRDRAVRLCRFPEDRVGVVPMTASSLVAPERVLPELRARFAHCAIPGFRILYLAGPIPNKRVHCLAPIARQILDAGVSDFVFVVTLPADHWYTLRVMNAFEQQGVRGHIVNTGPVASNAVASLIDTCDAMCTLSVLESFSNNFTEAWRMGKPLVVTDSDWSRSACGEAALYVDPEDADDTAQALRQLAASESFRNALAAAGRRRLELSPSPVEKTRLYLSHIERVRELGSLPPARRSAIGWHRMARAI